MVLLDAGCMQTMSKALHSTLAGCYQDVDVVFVHCAVRLTTAVRLCDSVLILGGTN